MQIIDPAEILVSPDEIFQAQGADPAVLRARRPRLYEEAVQAAQHGQELIQPIYWSCQLPVLSVKHSAILLAHQIQLKGELVLQKLAGAEQISFAILTLGHKLQAEIQRTIHTDPAFGLLLDTYGSLATDKAGQIVQDRIVQAACDQGYQTSMAISPGLIGWPIEQGQPPIFAALQPDPDQVRLSSSYQMLPQKSASFVIGLGQQMEGGNPCDYCSVKESCKQRKPSDPQAAIPGSA